MGGEDDRDGIQLGKRLDAAIEATRRFARAYADCERRAADGRSGGGSGLVTWPTPPAGLYEAMQVDTDHMRWWEWELWAADDCYRITTLNRVFRDELKRFRRHWQAVDRQDD